MPDRIQLSRQKGWRKPEGAVVVSRPARLPSEGEPDVCHAAILLTVANGDSDV